MSTYTPVIESLTLIPSSGGRFEVVADDTVLFSKKTLGRHAEPGEVAKSFEDKLAASGQSFVKK
jgi:selenoprotein W-related protein